MQAEINDYRDIGDYLRDVREAAGLDLRDIGSRLNIRPKYLIALEGGMLDDLPGKVYARGYLQNYAEYLGLDKEEIASAFDRVVEKPEVPYYLPEPSSKGYQPGMVMVGAAIVAMLVMYVFWYQSEHAAVNVALEVPVPAVPDRLANPQPVLGPEAFIGPPMAGPEDATEYPASSSETDVKAQTLENAGDAPAEQPKRETAPSAEEPLPWLQ